MREELGPGLCKDVCLLSVIMRMWHKEEVTEDSWDGRGGAVPEKGDGLGSCYRCSWCHMAICRRGFLSISSQWLRSEPEACRPRLQWPSTQLCPSSSWPSTSSSTLEACSRSSGSSNMIISFHTGLILCLARFVCFFFSFRAWCFKVTLTETSGQEQKGKRVREKGQE